MVLVRLTWSYKGVTVQSLLTPIPSFFTPWVEKSKSVNSSLFPLSTSPTPLRREKPGFEVLLLHGIRLTVTGVLFPEQLEYKYRDPP